MVNIYCVRKKAGEEHSFWVEYNTLGGEKLLDVYAQDELAAFIEGKRILEEKEMDNRWFVVCAAALLAVLILSLATCRVKETQATESARLSRIEACLKAGKSYAANGVGYVCAERPRFPGITEREAYNNEVK